MLQFEFRYTIPSLNKKCKALVIAEDYATAVDKLGHFLHDNVEVTHGKRVQKYDKVISQNFEIKLS